MAIVRSIRDWLPDCPVDDDTLRHGWSSDQCSDVKEKRKWNKSLSRYMLMVISNAMGGRVATFCNVH